MYGAPTQVQLGIGEAMTIETRCLIELSDILGVEFKCGSCGAKTLLDTDGVESLMGVPALQRDLAATADRRRKNAANFPESNKERKREDERARVFHEIAYHSAQGVARVKSENVLRVRAYTLTVNVNHAPHVGVNNGKLLLTLANCKPGIRQKAQRRRLDCGNYPKEDGLPLGLLDAGRWRMDACRVLEEI